MTAPWTPRERRMREALWEYRQCQRRMLDKWSESDQAGKDMLWRSLHKCESLAAAALADQPPPDPRDEALRLAEEALDTFSRAYVVSMEPFISGIDPADGASHWMPGGWPTVGEFKAAHEALAAIAAAKGEK